MPSINIITLICINSSLFSFVSMSLSKQMNLLLLLLLPSSHFSICSLLAPQSDPNHLIGVAIWVPDWPCCPPVWLCKWWLWIGTAVQPSSIRLHQPPSHPIPSTPCYVWQYCLLLPAFLHFHVISIICYSCMSPPSSSFFSSSRPHPSSSCRGMLKPVEVSNGGGPLGIHVVPFSLQDVR